MFYQNTDNNINKVIGVQFSILSPEEIVNSAVAEITTQETYDGNTPKIGGLFDPRMGILNHTQVCPTDNLNNKLSPGYFGYLRLAHPVFNVQFMKEICKILKCICLQCSKLRIPIKERLHSKRDIAFKKCVEMCQKLKN